MYHIFNTLLVLKTKIECSTHSSRQVDEANFVISRGKRCSRQKQETDEVSAEDTMWDNGLLPLTSSKCLTFCPQLASPPLMLCKNNESVIGTWNSFCWTTLTELLPEHLAVSQRLLQLKQSLFVMVLLHDHTSHFRTGEVARGGGHRALNWETHPNSMKIVMRFSDRSDKACLHQDPQAGKIPVLSEVYKDIIYKCFHQKCKQSNEEPKS